MHWIRRFSMFFWMFVIYTEYAILPFRIVEFHHLVNCEFFAANAKMHQFVLLRSLIQKLGQEMSAVCAIFNVYKFPICNTNTSGNENVSEFQWFLAEIRAHKFLDRIVPLNHSLLSNTFLYVNRSTPISLNWTQIKPNAIIVSPEINYLNSNNSSSYAKTEQKKMCAKNWRTKMAHKPAIRICQMIYDACENWKLLIRNIYAKIWASKYIIYIRYQWQIWMGNIKARQPRGKNLEKQWHYHKIYC